MKYLDDDHQTYLNCHQKLAAYQQRIANILESFTDGFFELNKEWIVTYWNTVAEHLTNIPKHQVLGVNIWKVFPEAVSSKSFIEYHRAIDENIPVHFEDNLPGTESWFEVTAFPSVEGLSVYFKDITIRKNATVLLELEKQKYRNLFNQSPLPQWVYEIETLKFLDVNEAAINHYGFNRQEFLGMTLNDIRPSTDIRLLHDILYDKSFNEFNKSSVKHQKKDGSLINVYVEENIIDFEGKNARMVMIIDRTAEILAINAMHDSVERYSIVSKATSDAIWDLNTETEDMTWNQGIRGIFGYRQTKYNLAWWRSKVHPDDLNRVLKKKNRTVQNGHSRFSVEYRFQTATGSYKTVLDRAFISFDADGLARRVIGSMQDITERTQHIRKIEAQNIKLKEISWIQAHKVRGPLASILGLIGLIDEKDLLNNDAVEIVSHLKSSAEKLDLVLKEIINKS